jgi:hypothetical protein
MAWRPAPKASSWSNNSLNCASVKFSRSAFKTMCRREIGASPRGWPARLQRGDVLDQLIISLGLFGEHLRVWLPKHRNVAHRIDDQRPIQAAYRAKAHGVKMGRKPKLTDHQRHEALKRRDHGEETLAEIGRSYNVSGWTISRLPR